MSPNSDNETNEVFCRWPVHEEISLCCLTQFKQQVLTLQQGHVYLELLILQISQVMIQKFNTSSTDIQPFANT